MAVNALHSTQMFAVFAYICTETDIDLVGGIGGQRWVGI